MDDKEPRKAPIEYDEGGDKPTQGAFRITGLAIGIAAVVCIVLIALVATRGSL